MFYILIHQLLLLINYIKNFLNIKNKLDSNVLHNSPLIIYVAMFLHFVLMKSGLENVEVLNEKDKKYDNYLMITYGL